jgi:hypothetical protein
MLPRPLIYTYTLTLSQTTVVRYFAYLYASQELKRSAAKSHGGKIATSSFRPLPLRAGSQLDAYVFVDALLEVCQHESEIVASYGKKCLKQLVDTIIAVCGEERTATLGITQELLTALNRSCFECKWNTNSAGMYGMSLLCDRLGDSWLHTNMAQIMRPLLFSFRDDESDFTVATRYEARSTLTDVINTCCTHAQRKWEEMVDAAKEEGNTLVDPALAVKLDPNTYLGADKEQDKKAAAVPEAEEGVVYASKSSTVYDAINILASELISSYEAVRMEARRLIELVSANMDIPCHVLIHPYRDRLILPVIKHSLQDVPVLIRIGYVSTAVFCISLRPQQLITVEDLKNLLQDAISDLNESTKEEQYIPGTTLNRANKKRVYAKLKVENLKLLGALLKCNEVLANPKLFKQQKDDVIRVFFNCLLKKDPALIAVAKEGLRELVKRETLLKELLQECLRPVLLKLPEKRHVTVTLLDCLANLLELLSNCFNTSFGDKLIEHLEEFASQPMEKSEEVLIASKILNLFHLLPSPPDKSYLETLVNLTMKLEANYPPALAGVECSGAVSPYRKPLFRYLNANANKTIEYFIRNLTVRNKSRIFHAVVRDPEISAVRGILIQSPDQLIRVTYDYAKSCQNDKTVDMSAVDELQLQGAALCHILSGFHPQILRDYPLVDCLFEVWESPEFKNRQLRAKDESSKPQLALINETKIIVECFILFCEQNIDDAPRILWAMLNVFLTRTMTDFGFLIEFYKREVGRNYSNLQKRALLHSFFEFFRDIHKPQLLKVHALRCVIIPMLEAGMDDDTGTDEEEPIMAENGTYLHVCA